MKHPVKSGNERDPRPQLPAYSLSDGYTVGTAAAKAEEGMGNGRSVCPEYPGLHASYNGWYNGYLPRKGMEIS